MADEVFAPSPRAKLRQQLGLALMQKQGANPRATPWVGGLADIANTALGAFMLNRGIDEQESNEAALGDGFKQWQAQPAGSRPGFTEFAAGSANPSLAKLGQRLLMKQEMTDPAKETFGTSFQSVAGPDGQPMLVQVGNRGSVRPVSGLSPAAEKPMLAAGGTMLVDPRTGEARDIPGAREAVMAQRSAGGTRVSVGGPSVMVKESDKTFGEWSAKDYAARSDRAKTTANVAQRLDRVNQILGDEGGPGADWKLKASELASAFGVTGPQREAWIARMQAGGSEAGQLVMDQLNAMKGPATEREREYLEKMTPGLTMLPAARRALGTIAKRQAARDAAVLRRQVELLGSPEFRSGALHPAQIDMELQRFAAELGARDDAAGLPGFGDGRGAPPQQPAGQATKTWRPGEGFK
jgi:hypothetical protein